MVGLGIAVLIIGLTIRIIVSYFSVLGGDLNLKERLFVTLGMNQKQKIREIKFLKYFTFFSL